MNAKPRAILYNEEMKVDLFIYLFIFVFNALSTRDDKNSAEGYVAPGKDHVSMTCNCNSYS